MSRLSKQPIAIPSGVEAQLEGNNLTLKGPKGELSRSFNENAVSLEIKDNALQVQKTEDTVFSRALVGTYASHVKNMIEVISQLK